MTPTETAATDKKLEAIKAAARGATQGEWISTGIVIGVPVEGGLDYIIEATSKNHDADMLYLEAVQPQVVLALIERLERAEAREDVRELRDAGYAVAVFSPEELRGAKPSTIEDLMVSRGNDAIVDLGDEGADEDETYKPTLPVLATEQVLVNLRALRAAVAEHPEDQFDLAAWRTSGPTCGTMFCIGGLAATMPFFQRQGMYPDAYDGAPRTQDEDDVDEVLNHFFGLYDEDNSESAYDHIFTAAGDSMWDSELRVAFHTETGRSPTDKELALARLDKAIKHWEMNP